MANLNIFCVIEGQTTSFSVKVPSDGTVDDLKDAIKAKIPKFKEIAAHDLTLWRVNIPDEDKVLMKDKVRPEEKEVTTKDKVVLTEGMDIVRSADGSTYSTRLLSPSSMTLSDGDAFGAGSLKGRTIYVIVQLPQPGNATFCSMQAFQRALSSSTIVPIIDAYSSPIASKRSFEDAGEYSCL